ncbi:hypothetical protein [Streptomyces sp. L2]|uniref:hypothetical protein n=1 Tax=Streptomyces sp. L2 TaxID=2162665 RepID=UPI001012A629|nr:hypothetical protein [Streptomyces sp. L2]
MGSLVSGISPAKAAAANCPQHPSDVRGLKLLGTYVGPQPDDLGLRFETQKLPYSTAAGVLANNGFRTVALRVAAKEDLHSGQTIAQRDAEVIKLLRELNRQHTNVYLYEREWFQRKDGPAAKYPGADAFIRDMSNIVSRAKKENLRWLRGVMPIETNLNNTWEVRERALYVARGINARTGNWLKTHTFMMPGAGMGNYFKDIQKGGVAWLNLMRGQTGCFSFIYKHMRSQPAAVNDLAKYNDRWKYYVGLRSETTVDRQVKFLQSDSVFGLGDLAWYMQHYKSKFPNHANVVFWGDAADGVSFLSQLDSRYNYNTLRALHQVLVKSNRWLGYFFDMPFGKKGAQGHDLWKYQILVGPLGGRDRNMAMNRSGTHTVWDEWHAWANPSFQY